MSTPQDGKGGIGEVAFQIIIDKKRNTIRFQYNRPVTWMEFNLEAATRMRDILVAKVDELRALI